MNLIVPWGYVYDHKIRHWYEKIIAIHNDKSTSAQNSCDDYFALPF